MLLAVRKPSVAAIGRPQRRRCIITAMAHAGFTQQPSVPGSTVWGVWQRVREARPLTQCITNYVSMDIMANVLLAAGASPAMVS